MKKSRVSLLALLIIGSAIFTGGCEKKEEEPEVISDLFFISDEQRVTDTEAETENGMEQSLETAPETVSEQEAAVNQASPSEADKDINAAPQTDSTTSVAMVTVAKTFQPGDEWTSDISFQIPENWSYAAEESGVDWGFFIQVQQREDATIRVFGQYGTLNVESFYENAPEAFATTGGMKGELYQKKHTEEDGTSRIEGDIVFDLGSSYGVSFNMPETAYDENKEAIQKLFESIVIQNTFVE